MLSLLGGLISGRLAASWHCRQDGTRVTCCSIHSTTVAMGTPTPPHTIATLIFAPRYGHRRLCFRCWAGSSQAASQPPGTAARTAPGSPVAPYTQPPWPWGSPLHPTLSRRSARAVGSSTDGTCRVSGRGRLVPPISVPIGGAFEEFFNMAVGRYTFAHG